MTDFEFADLGFESEHQGELVGPPTIWLWVTVAIAFVSIVFFFINSAVGYGIAIIASITGSLVVFQDQKKRSNPNYVSFTWFTSVTQLTRYAITAIALAHIIVLAIESAR